MEKNKYTFSFENDEMVFYVEENIAVLRFKDNFLSKLSDIEKSGKIFTVFDWIEKDPIVNTLLLFNNEDSFSEKAYCSFMDEITKYDDNSGKYNIIAEKKLYLTRQIHAARIIINKLINFEKNLIFCLKGNVSTLAFGISLVCDYRFAESSLVFSLPNKKYSLPPIGGLPFLLEKYIGHQETSKLMLEGKMIEAGEALELRILNEVFETENFEQECISKAKELLIKDDVFRKITKRLMNSFTKDLEDYFNYESKISGY